MQSDAEVARRTAKCFAKRGAELLRELTQRLRKGPQSIFHGETQKIVMQRLRKGPQRIFHGGTQKIVTQSDAKVTQRVVKCFSKRGAELLRELTQRLREGLQRNSIVTPLGAR